MKSKYILFMTALVMIFTGCKIDEIENLNNPTLEDFENSTTLDDLLLLVTGTESSMRVDLGHYVNQVCIVGREYYDLNGTDPRYTGELLGAQGAPLDPGGFLTNRSYSARYGTIRNAQVLLNSLQNTTATLSTAEENGFSGFAKTIQAYEFLLNLNMQNENSIRIDVADPDNLGPFVSYDEALSSIRSLLNTASSELNNAGSEFVFTLTDGFSGFDTPETFNQFNRAIAARAAIYDGDKSGALNLLDDSFFDLAGDLNTGVGYTYDAGDGVFNPLFRTADDFFMAQEDWVNSAEAGDTRLSKVEDFVDDIELDDLASSWHVNVYATNSDNAHIIRNEELVLLYAEANIGSDNTEAIAAIDVIRAAAGLPGYSGGTDNAAVLDEVLHQRRYSLFAEGHRWIDMRRNNKLGDIFLDRPGDVVHLQFPRPLNEQ